MINLQLNASSAGDALWQATFAIHHSGMPLMSRILPDDSALNAFQHYPPKDVVNGHWHARWFYHCHNPDDRVDGEHGHFHLFLGRSAFCSDIAPLIAPPSRRKSRPSIVHIAALSMCFDGLPAAWFTTNRWVTDEWLYPAEAIIEKIPQISFVGDDGDPLANEWLGSILRASRDQIATLLVERDLRLAACDPTGEDHSLEVVSQSAIDFDLLLNA
jgi:hypothetical protein